MEDNKEKALEDISQVGRELGIADFDLERFVLAIYAAIEKL